MSPVDQNLLPPHGNYRELLSYQKAANIAFCLVHQTDYLLDQQIRRPEKDFVEQGGMRERMTRARVRYRAANE